MRDGREGAGRRGFLARLGVTLGGLTLAAREVHAQGEGEGEGQGPGVAPMRHPEDDWMDALPTGHRMMFDATTLSGAAHAGAFAGNFIFTNGTGYKVKPDQLGVVIVLRHLATAFAFTDPIWAKYGKTFSDRLKSTDPATGEAWTTNPFLHPSPWDGPVMGVQWTDLVARGVHFAVCAAATRNLAGLVARDLKVKADEVREELVASQIGNAHQMASGILAVGRLQEKGYPFAYGG